MLIRTADAGTAGYIVQSLVCATVYPGVEESESWLAFGDQSIVDQGNNTSKCWRSSRSTTDSSNQALRDDSVVVTLSRNIRVSTALLIIKTIIQAV